MNIKTSGNQVFNVPNNEEGREFLRLLRKFRNRGWHYRARGRGSRKEHGCQHGIGQEHSEWMAVYMDNVKRVRRPAAPPPGPQVFQMPLQVVLVRNEGHSFLPGEAVALNGDRAGFPAGDKHPGILGVAVEACNPNEPVKVKIRSQDEDWELDDWDEIEEDIDF